MIWVDYVIIGIIALSAVLSLFRGFFREAISLTGWILAIWLAVNLGPLVAVELRPYIQAPSLRMFAGYGALFLGTLLAAGLLSWLVGKLVASTGLSSTDRVLGMVFGAARGAIVVVVLVLVARSTAIPRDVWWQRSVLLPHFEMAAAELRRLMPPELDEYLNFPSTAPAAPGPAPRASRT